MRTIYIDDGYHCYTVSAADRTAVQTDALDGKCDAYIEGMRYLPPGSIWTRDDGETFAGPMLSPWRDSASLEAAQGVYDELAPTIDDILIALSSKA
ncbi:MAG: hypothetical protein RR998_06350 [Oscillospiraceae bacterium]